MKRKVLSVLLVALFAVMVVGSALKVSAAGVAEVKVSSPEGYAGDEVTVEVDLTENSGSIIFDLAFGYDADVLELVSVNKGNVLLGDAWTDPNPARNPLKVIGGNGLSTVDSTETGRLFTLVFKIKDDAAVGIYEFTLSGAISDKDLNDLETNVTSGSVTVLCPHKNTSWIVDSEATCTEAGSKHAECTECGEAVATEAIAATGHTTGEWIVDSEATCTETGSKHAECTACGETVSGEIAATGHTFGEWSIVKEATEEEEGI